MYHVYPAYPTHPHRHSKPPNSSFSGEKQPLNAIKIVSVSLQHSICLRQQEVVHSRQGFQAPPKIVSFSRNILSLLESASPLPSAFTHLVFGLRVRPRIHEHPRHRLMPLLRSVMQRRPSILRRAPVSACTRPLRRPPPPSNGTSLSFRTNISDQPHFIKAAQGNAQSL